MDMLYAHALFLNARRYPQKPAIVFDGRPWTYAALQDRVARIGAVLALAASARATGSAFCRKIILTCWR